MTAEVTISNEFKTHKVYDMHYERLQTNNALPLNKRNYSSLKIGQSILDLSRLYCLTKSDVTEKRCLEVLAPAAADMKNILPDISNPICDLLQRKLPENILWITSEGRKSRRIRKLFINSPDIQQESELFSLQSYIPAIFKKHTLGV
jgi:hypothetical protein